MLIFEPISQIEKESRAHRGVSLNEAPVVPCLGIAWNTSGTILLYKSFGIDDVSFVDLHKADIKYNKASSIWRLYKDLSHNNAVHEGFDFKRFDFLGVERVMNEENFLSEYFDEKEDCINYVRSLVVWLIKAESDERTLDKSSHW